MKGGGQDSVPPDGTFSEVALPHLHETFDAPYRMHGCALQPDGVPACWGARYPTTGEGAPSDPLTALSVAESVDCGVRTDATLSCWSLVDKSAVGEWMVPQDGGFVAVDSDGIWTCALEAGGSVRCWSTTRMEPESVRQPAIEDLVQLAVMYHGCGTTTDGGGLCWSPRHDDPADAPSPPLQPPRGEYSQVVPILEWAGCGLRTDATLQCWSHGADPVTWKAHGRFVALSHRYDDVCGLTASGRAECFGYYVDDDDAIPSCRVEALSDEEVFGEEDTEEAECGLTDLEFSVEVRDVSGSPVRAFTTYEDVQFVATIHNPCPKAVTFTTRAPCLVTTWTFQGITIGGVSTSCGQQRTDWTVPPGDSLEDTLTWTWPDSGST